MNILNMYMLQCILCASERTYFQIHEALQIKLLLLLFTLPTGGHNARNAPWPSEQLSNAALFKKYDTPNQKHHFADSDIIFPINR